MAFSMRHATPLVLKFYNFYDLPFVLGVSWVRGVGAYSPAIAVASFHCTVGEGG